MNKKTSKLFIHPKRTTYAIENSENPVNAGAILAPKIKLSHKTEEKIKKSVKEIYHFWDSIKNFQVPPEYKTKENKTQGHRKIIQHLEDIERNTNFEKYLVITADNILKNKSTDFNILIQLLTKSGIDISIFLNYLLSKISKNKEINNALDVCIIRDKTSYLNPKLFANNPTEWTRIACFPVSIEINKLATKNDVRNFIENNWEEIEKNLKKFRVNKKTIIRRRKIDLRIRDLIWENRNKKTTEIKRLIVKEFPENTLNYEEILNLKKTENKRRNSEF